VKSARILVLVLTALLVGPRLCEASGPRQYYDTNWSYNTTNNYYYVNYYYRPLVTQPTYDYHYCIYHESQPRYIYYYNPTTQAYWGRYEIGSKGDARYSILAAKDRKKDLKDIPETAFPKPAKMPSVPGAKDSVAIEPPPENVPDKKPGDPKGKR